jgi:hypothetical protein
MVCHQQVTTPLRLATDLYRTGYRSLLAASELIFIFHSVSRFRLARLYIGFNNALNGAQPRCVLGRHSDVFPDSELPVALKVCTIGGLERAMRPGMRNLK